MFEWHTGQKEGWDEPVVRQTAVSRQINWQRWVRPAVVLFTIVLLINWGIQRRVARFSAAAERDILATHNLVQRATAQQDPSLLRLVLPASDEAWTKSQIKLIYADADAHLQQLASLNKDQDTLSNIDIQFARNLQTASVRYERQYQWSPDREPFGLWHTAVYQQNSDRWQYARPNAAYWGEWQIVTFSRLKVTYPKRDEPTLEPLLLVLNGRIETLCTHAALLPCADNWQLDLRFETDPTSLTTLTDLSLFLGQPGQYELPTPTLVGVPDSEEGMRFLTMLYSDPLLYAAIAEQTNYPCCRNGQFFRAIADQLLSEIGWRPDPLTDERIQQLLVQDTTMAQLERNWANSIRSDENRAQTDALIAFLRPYASPIDMLNALSQHLSYDAWRDALVEVDEDNLEQHWDSFVLLHAQRTAPLPPPAESLLTSCQTQSGEWGDYLYRFDRREWELVEEDFNNQQPTANNQQSTNEPFTIHNSQFTIPHSPSLSLALGENTAVTTDFAFFPWRYPLLLLDDGGEVVSEIGEGGLPLWLDAQTVGYVGVVENSARARRELALFVYDTENEARTQLLTVTNLLDTFPEAPRPNQLTIRQLLQHPQQPELLVLQTSGSFAYDSPQQIFLVELDGQHNTVRDIQFLAEFPSETSFSFSPNAHWLQINEQTPNRLTLYSFATGDLVKLTSNSDAPFVAVWTVDNTAVLQYRDSQLLLYNPSTHAYRLISHSFQTCTDPIWQSK